ncbi:hypothetical protein BJ878DRAFT_153393 [Calycina marina]|uniref:Uncharacterized protein n=1 Tax=Calycina marina TaxID=1763456 RepID=A0A9P7Z924_9HELO|nr:hypothetical protein BJ878DRAFT_153393 [Calycina marina]
MYQTCDTCLWAGTIYPVEVSSQSSWRPSNIHEVASVPACHSGFCARSLGSLLISIERIWLTLVTLRYDRRNLNVSCTRYGMLHHHALFKVVSLLARLSFVPLVSIYRSLWCSFLSLNPSSLLHRVGGAMVFSLDPCWMGFLLFSLSSGSATGNKLVHRVVQNTPSQYQVRGAYPVYPLNGTASTSSSSSLISGTTSSVLSTITSAPWPTYSTSYCSVPSTQNTDYCRVHPGTVEVHFFPTSGNLSYPSTQYVSEYDFTMTKPSVYFVINTISALNWCDEQIGPPQTNFVYSMNLDQVTTLQSYANAEATTRVGLPEQLQLNDLSPNCPTVQESAIPYGNHNINSDGCNPVLEWTVGLKNSFAK